MAAARVLICDHMGLRLDAGGRPDFSEAKAHVESRGGFFHDCSVREAGWLAPDRIHFFYQPDLSSGDELLGEAGKGEYDAVISAATILPAETVFCLGGVRIGAGTGNMRSASWGGSSGKGGEAALMNTPGINSRATAQMVFKALLKVRPCLSVDELHARVSAGNFDTGRDLKNYPVDKLEGKRLAIIGYGNIGREVAKLGQAFGMEVVVYARERHRSGIEADGCEYAPTIERAAQGADVLSIHIGLGRFDDGNQRYANACVIDDTALLQLNCDAVLINYDRGELVDVQALSRAMAGGRVAHAAIDADLFKDAATGVLSGPMVPYLSLVDQFGDRLELLPHAAADTDHPSRVAGAKQAIDQIVAMIEDRHIHNLVGSLPEGYRDCGKQVPAGIGGLTGRRVAEIAQLDGVAGQLAKDAATLSEFWNGVQRAEGQRAFIEKYGRGMTSAAGRMAQLMRQLGLQAPYDD